MVGDFSFFKKYFKMPFLFLFHVLSRYMCFMFYV